MDLKEEYEIVKILLNEYVISSYATQRASNLLDLQQKEIERLNEVVEDRTGDVVHLYEENERLKKGIKLAMKHTYDDDTHEFLDRLLKRDTKDVPDYRLKIE